MAASDYVPIFFKNRLHLAGRPQMSTRPKTRQPKNRIPFLENWNTPFQKTGTLPFQKTGTLNRATVPENWNIV